MLAGVLTVKHALDRSCRWHPKRAALLEGERVVTFAEFGDACRRVANGYARLGVRKGDRVALLCNASAEHAVAYYAAQQLGAIPVNLHFRETTAQQINLLQRLEARVLVHDAEKTPAAQAIAAAVSGLITVGIGEQNGVRAAASLAELLSERADESGVEVRETDPAVIQLSSGSTGQPKALVHSHASVLESWSGGLYMWSGIEPHDRFLNAFSPSFTVWIVHSGAFLAFGASVVFQTHWNPLEFLALADSRNVTCTALTSTQWRAVLAGGPEGHRLGGLRMAAYLGEKIAPERLKELTERVCSHFCSFYGMSECLGIGGCSIRSSEFVELNKWGSIGKPVLNSDLRVTEPGGLASQPKGSGESGEIVVRSASFADANWGDPDWRSRVLTADGWYRSGDLGYVDDDGYVFLLGRVDNQIATGGIKVSPEEIEQVIDKHPGIAEVAVLGAADDKWGERVVALVVARSGALNADELDRWCREEDRLAPYKRPKQWVFVSSLPQSSVGKRDRKPLPQLLADTMRASATDA